MAKIKKSPRTWNQLIEIMEFLSDMDGMDVRLPDDQRFYEVYLELVPRDIAVETVRRLMDSKPITLIQNNFPYTKTLKYLPDVKHYCLWSLSDRLDKKEIAKHVNKTVHGKKWIYFERTSNKKSVPEIWHCHIFVKEK